MNQAEIANMYEICKEVAAALGLKVDVLGTNFVIQQKGGTVVYLHPTVDAIKGFLDGLRYANR